MNNVVGNAMELIWMADSNVTLYANLSLNNCEVIDWVIIQVLSVESSLFEPEIWCSWDTVLVSVPNPNSQCNYQWQSNSQIISELDSSAVYVIPFQSSWYYLTTSIPGCEVLDSIWIASSTLNPDAIQVSASDGFIGVGGTVNVDCTPVGFDYDWSPIAFLQTSNMASATFVLTEDTWIYAEVIDGQCRLTDSVLVKVESVLCGEPFVFVPNVFSPNGDGLHDAIGIQSSLHLDGLWMIRDRMGNEVFRTTSLNDNWNGTYKGLMAEPGVYHYYLKVNCPNGEVWEKEGNITLMR
jgi:gliding motility-associated-like protein